MARISANLWLDDKADEAASFYTSLLPDSAIRDRTLYAEAGKEIHGQEPGSVMTVDFELAGFRFTALNGGPHFTPNPSVSFFIRCETPDEVERLWNTLSVGGTPLMPLDQYPFSERYGWIQDRFGFSWQLGIYPDGVGTQRIVPSMLFVRDVCGKAEEAIRFYTSVFHNSRAGEIARYGPDQAPDREGTIMYAELELEGQSFVVMDSAQDHQFSFNEAISFVVEASTQEEIDYYWNRLSADPEAEQCGWLKDKFGVSWQVFPVSEMTRMLNDGQPDRVNDVMNAMLSMKKIDLAGLRAAHSG